jgi:DNA polymerase I-like protein with 3'-5' exonuclease and polymerase domains
MDTKWTDLLVDHLEPMVLESDIYELEYQRKLVMAPTLAMITDKGFPADLEYAKQLSQENQKKIADLEKLIRRTPEVEEYTRRFGSFSPTNANHVLALLKTVLKRPEVRVEERGESKDSSGEKILSALPVSEVPSAPLIVEHREITRNESNYILPVLEGKLLSHDGWLHPSYSSMVAVTGRLSSEAHNWPKRKHKEVRGIVSTEHLPDKVWIVPCDYGQIEFRVAGMLSQDKNLVKYCWTGYDVHKYWAQRIVDEYPEIKDYIVEAFEVDWDEKGLKTLRQEAKNGWVFPQLFGSSVKSCATQLHVPLDIMELLAEEFWDEFQGVKRWQEKVLSGYERNLYVETLGGRRRRGPMTRNEAINMGIQGTALDIVTAAMNALSEISVTEDDPEYQCNFNGHDDLTFLLRDETLEPKLDRIVLEMCRPRFDYINVPLVVEASIGTRWHQVKEVGVYRSDVLFNIPNPYK